MRSGKTHKFESSDILIIYKLARFGFSVSEIAKYFNVNHSSIYRIFEREGIPSRITIEECLSLEDYESLNI